VVLLRWKTLGRSESLSRVCSGRSGVQVSYDNGIDPVSFVVSSHLRRRHLTASQRSMLVARLAKLGRGRRWKKTGVSTEQAAALVNVSDSSVEHARRP